MPRLAILEGYSTPFGAYKHKQTKLARSRRAKKASKKRSSRKTGGRKAIKQKTRMKLCIRSWKSGRRKGKYRTFMAKCLSGKVRVKRPYPSFKGR